MDAWVGSGTRSSGEREGRDEDEGRIQGKKANMGKSMGPLEEYKVLLTEFWMTKHLTN